MCRKNLDHSYLEISNLDNVMFVFRVAYFFQSKAFQKTTQKVKEKKRWDSIKMKVLLTGIGVVVAAVIVGIIIYNIVGAAEGSNNQEDKQNGNTGN